MSGRRTRRAAAASAALLLAACSGDFGERVHEQFHQSVPVSGAASVHVENIAGSIRIDAWQKPSAELHAIKIDIRSEGGSISIATRYSGETHRGGVRYAIEVPANASLDVKNVVGLVEVTGVQGDVSVGTQAGAITADLGRVDGNRTITLSATTGAIRLRLSPDSSASVEAASAVGAISSEFPNVSPSRENLVGARASGTIGAGSAKIQLTTTTGAISLRQ
jgi:hypothetical protein